MIVRPPSTLPPLLLCAEQTQFEGQDGSRMIRTVYRIVGYSDWNISLPNVYAPNEPNFAQYAICETNPISPQILDRQVVIAYDTAGQSRLGAGLPTPPTGRPLVSCLTAGRRQIRAERTQFTDFHAPIEPNLG